jgi:hypothetical protein
MDEQKKRTPLGFLSLIFAILAIIIIIIALSIIFLGIGGVATITLTIFIPLYFIFPIVAIILGAIAYFGKSKDIIGLIGFILGIILIVTTPIAIAATVYVYVTDMVPNGISTSENAAAVISQEESKIIVILAMGGQNYGDGYTDYAIYINSVEIVDLPIIWQVGQQIIIGADNGGYIVDGDGLNNGVYSVTVTILNSVIYDGDITIV